MKIASWNIRGLNENLKQNEVKDFLFANKIDVMGLLETKIKHHKYNKVAKRFNSPYSIINNNDCHFNGRVWFIWNTRTVRVKMINKTEQYIHCEVIHNATNKMFYVTMVYASNDAGIRTMLWKALMHLATNTTPWIVMGDFNIVRTSDERMGPNPPKLTDMLEFNNCILGCQLEDLKGIGCEYTWTNKQEANHRVWSKLDRALVNMNWIQNYTNSVVQFLPAGTILRSW